MSTIRFSTLLSAFRASLSLPTAIALCLSGWLATAHADLEGINKEVWRIKYNVSPAQIADTNWLSASTDTDGDGLSNLDELAAGTDPFLNTSNLTITATVDLGANVKLSFPSQDGKSYMAEGATSPSGPWTALPAGNPTTVAGNGLSMDITVPKAGNTFFRIRSSDIDATTDNDGASEWAEKILGYNPSVAMTNGTTLDGVAISGELASFNVVTVAATKSRATQPSPGDAPVDIGSITVSRGIGKIGPLSAPNITVGLAKTGTAVEGTDYDTLPASVSFNNPNTREIILALNPMANAARKTNVAAIVQVQSGTGYALGAPTSASVVINPAGVADGTGLTGKYYNKASGLYASKQLPIFNGPAQMTRVDSVIDFANTIASISTGNPCTVTTVRPHEIPVGSGMTVRISGVPSGTFTPTINATHIATATGANTFTVPVNCTVAPASVVGAIVGGTNGWDTASGPVGMTPGSTTSAFSVRWTGQVLPQYSETYTFDFKSDDGAKVWVDGVLVIDRWVTQDPAVENTNTINLQAGTLYDIQIDYANMGGNAEARLYWWSDSQVKQIIPQGRLYPAAAPAAKFTAITSSLSAIGYEGVPFNFAVTTPAIGAATTFALAAGSAPLPPGLTLNTNTGVISGTPTVAGLYNVAINATNVAAAAVTGSSVLDITIYPSGSLTRETLAGNTVTADGTIPTLDDDTDYANGTVRRLRGYVVPPKSGNYYFFLAASNTAEFWLSNDAESVNVVERASVTSSTGKKVWNAQATQKSQWLALEAGQKYYFEVRHNTGSVGDDYVALGWCQDDVGTLISTVDAPNPNGDTPLIPNGGAALTGYPLSGVTPSFLYQPYDYPTIAASTGSLYASNLGPQGSSTTKASGSANLRVDFNNDQAILHFTYSGLTTPRTAYHLHTDAFSTHPAGEIIYDIDDIDAFHPELRTPDGGYIWNFGPVGTFTTAQQIKDAITLGKVYLNIHSVTYPAGEIRGNLQLVDGSQTPPDATAYAEPNTNQDSASNYAHAARFLNQASFGASPSDIQYVQSNGFLGWINNQLTKDPSHTSDDVVNGLTSDINQPYPSTLFTNTWWKYAITGQDQLRQRYAFALSEIMVVSWANNTGPLQNNGRILADYSDQLVDYCLPTPGVAESGTFRGILKQVTLTPAMGLYLDMRANKKGDDSIGLHPNENYAREIMQLFSVGLNRMWDDGRFVVDSKANLVPVYDQRTILGLSALLTGWNYNQALQGNGRLPTNFGPGADYLNPMMLVPTQHEFREHKLLLDRVVSPAASGITPRVSIGTMNAGTPCTINTTTIHGLKVGDTVYIAGVVGGTFSPALNGVQQVTEVVDADSFKVAVNCTKLPRTYANATVTGTTVKAPAIVGTGGVIPAVTGSQADSVGTGSNHPYDMYGLTELEVAIDNIVNNENTPPYICRQLIQRLVTSDPSPGYVYRVVQKFKDNGSGVRGDMVAVIKQILLDGEARSTTNAAANDAFGKQREPMLRLTGPARAFPAVDYTGTYTQIGASNPWRIRVTTSTAHDFSVNFPVSLNFRGNYVNPPSGQTIDPITNPTTTTYTIQSVPSSTTFEVNATGMISVNYSQPANSSTMTITATGPQTNVPIPSPNSGTTTLKSKVFLDFLTVSGGAAPPMPTDGVYLVQTNGTGTFTVTSTPTYTSTRTGTVQIPRISTSYTPQSSNTIVQFNNNTNHNMPVGTNVWVDVPVIGNPLSDAEYVLTETADEDHFKTSYLPVSSGLGTYPKPSGSTNSVTLWPLIAAPTGRSGTVVVNQSTFNLGSTESTLTQSPLNAPTVFNFFFPDYKFPGDLSNNGVDSPEFQLSTDTNLVNLTNSMTNMFIGTGGGNSNLVGLSSFSNGDGKVVMDIGSYMTGTKASNAEIPTRVDELANILVGGPLDTTTRTTIINFVANTTNFPYTTPTDQQKRDRIRAIIHLILTSAEFAVQK